MDIVALYYYKLCFSGATRHGDSHNASQIRQPHENKIYWKLIVSFFRFSLENKKVNSKTWGETYFEVPKKQKDVWSFVKI